MTKIRQLWRVIRTCSQFHENERLIAWSQKQRVIAWLTPTRRRSMLFYGAIVAGLIGTYRRYRQIDNDTAATFWFVPFVVFPLLLGFLYLIYRATVHYEKLPRAVRRYPQLSLHLLFWAILTALWFVPEDLGVWKSSLTAVAISFPFLIWRSGYMLMSGQRGKAKNTSFRDHLIYLWPIWGGSNTPIGKGSDYLSQCEARTSESYSRSVLAGAKLMALSVVLELVKLLLRVVLSLLKVPPIKEIITGRIAASLFTTWMGLYIELFRDTVQLAARGHRWIAVLRLFGFNAFRNTYKPLLAESIIDFWNRYYYYFKELLVEFFFYSTYLSAFRKHPKLRMFTAVFAAAFAGNLYYHFLQTKISLALGDVLGVAKGLSPRMIYCFFLALGVFFSMVRQQQRRGKVYDRDPVLEPLAKLRRIAGVWTFYSLLNFWNLKTGLPILERLRFFISLFGL